jgi:diguanylate cyclase (GGDEF)-like protein
MPRPDLPADEALLDELESLGRELRLHTAGGDVSALVRLIRSDPSWAQVLRRRQMEHWFVLPLHGDKHPALTELKRRLDELTALQGLDPLTGLANRRGFDQAMALEVERSGRFRTPLTLCVMDLDDFKAVNDTYGHPCGDTALKAVASILEAETRLIDTAARIGGEEFAILLPGTGLVRACKLLERIQAAVFGTRIRCGETEFSVTMSMGVAGYRGKHVPDAAVLMEEADQAMYRAKRAGKNRIETAPILDLALGEDHSLVHQNEKRFLFSSFFAPAPHTGEDKD